MSPREKDCDDRNDSGKQSNDQKPGGQPGQHQQNESERSGRFQDRVEKLERPGDWPDPPAEKE